MSKLRKLDDLGRLVLPLELRESLGWEKYQEIRIELDKTQNALILKAGKPQCVCCGAEESLQKLPGGKAICQTCLAAAIQ